MTRQRTEQDTHARAGDHREDPQRLVRKRQSGSSTGELNEKEDQADSGPDRDHLLTRQSQEK
jgi:hypothetical protein